MLHALLLLCTVLNLLTKIKVAGKVCNIVLTVNIYIYFFFNCVTLCRIAPSSFIYEGWNFNSGNYLFTTDTK